MPLLHTDLDIAGHWIDGRLERDADRFGDVFDPATGAVQRRIPLADAATVDRAVASAQAAFEQWGPLSLSRRTAVPSE